MIPDKVFFSVLFLCLLTALTGMFMIPLMDIDAAQYASISREMLEKKSFLQFYDLGADYLDKPPMLFWLSGLSLSVFGIHDWAYRLPSFLFVIMAVYATYRLAKLYYAETVARLSAMVLASSQAIFLITHDTRCDTMLMGWVALSLWQLAEWYQQKRWKYFFMAAMAIAGGMMTKGPIALIVPILAFVPHFILRREWKQLFRWEYVLAILIIAVLLIPMSVGLYMQYDLHPGKLINGVPIRSGLRFFYWTQSFGRYTGENMYHEMSYFTFLLENMLWSFLPWILFFLVGLLFSFKDILTSRFRLRSDQEWISTGGFVLTYCILARSQAQLPHYIFVVFPLAAIVTAVFLHQLLFTDKMVYLRKPLQWLHVLIFAILWVASVALMQLPFKSYVSFTVVILAVIGFVGLFVLLKQARTRLSVPSILAAALYTVIGVNLLLSTNFYPNLLQFQMGNTAADFINRSGIDKNKVVLYGVGDSRALHFYGQHIFTHKNGWADIRQDDILITAADSIPVVQSLFPSMKVLHKGPHYPVTILTPEFLNPATRERGMNYYAIIDLNGTDRIQSN